MQTATTLQSLSRCKVIFDHVCALQENIHTIKVKEQLGLSEQTWGSFLNFEQEPLSYTFRNISSFLSSVDEPIRLYEACKTGFSKSEQLRTFWDVMENLKKTPLLPHHWKLLLENSSLEEYSEDYDNIKMEALFCSFNPLTIEKRFL
jgi:hypothetical protein